MATGNERFEKRKRESLYWRNKASDLMVSAGVVWASQDPIRSKEIATALDISDGHGLPGATTAVFQMLCGMALELAYKAIIVSAGKNPNKTHDLNSLANAAGLRPTDQQRGLLSLLTGSIVWDGRYPVPKYPADFAKLVALKEECLFDKFPFGDSSVLRRNDALKWDSFMELWSEAIWIYDEHFEREYGLRRDPG